MRTRSQPRRRTCPWRGCGDPDRCCGEAHHEQQDRQRRKARVVQDGETATDNATGGQQGQGAAPDTGNRGQPDRRQSPPFGVSFQWFRRRGHRPGWSR